jgi:ParB family chromosome partitioning protein
MNYKYDWADLDSIDTTNSFYRVTTPQDKLSFYDSVRRIGLICPVVVKEANSRLIVISGFRRVETCRQLGWNEIYCRILSDDVTPLHCAELAIADNLAQRPLNIVEQARCLRLLTEASHDSKVSVEMANSLGLSLNKAFVSKLKTVLSASETIQLGIILGKLGLPIALLLSELSNDDADAVALLFNRIPMGLNKQREVLLYLKEVSARDDTSVKHLLEEDTIKSALDKDDLDGNQKTHIIRSYLKKRRYPRLAKVERQFHEQVRKLRLGEAIQIMPPANFEGSSYTMTIRFNSINALIGANSKISDAIANPIASKLFGCS